MDNKSISAKLEEAIVALYPEEAKNSLALADVMIAKPWRSLADALLYIAVLAESSKLRFLPNFCNSFIYDYYDREIVLPFEKALAASLQGLRLIKEFIEPMAKLLADGTTMTDLNNLFVPSIRKEFPGLTLDEARQVSEYYLDLKLQRQKHSEAYLEEASELFLFYLKSTGYDKVEIDAICFLIQEKGNNLEKAKANRKRFKRDLISLLDRKNVRGNQFLNPLVQHAAKLASYREIELEEAFKLGVKSPLFLSLSSTRLEGYPALKELFFSRAADALWRDNNSDLKYRDVFVGHITKRSFGHIRAGRRYEAMSWIALQWAAHMLGVDPGELRHSPGYDGQAFWLNHSTMEHLEALADIAEFCVPFDFDDRSNFVDAFTPVLKLYHQHVEPVLMFVNELIPYAEPYLDMVLSTYLNDRLDSFASALAICSSILSDEQNRLRAEFPYLPTAALLDIQFKRRFVDEDVLKEHVEEKCRAEQHHDVTEADTEAYLAELVNWLCDHPGMDFPAAVASYHAFLDQEAETLMRNDWQLPAEICKRVIWQYQVQGLGMSQGIADYYALNLAIQYHFPMFFTYEESEIIRQTRTFAKSVAVMLVEAKQPITLKEAIRTKKQLWYEDELEKRVRLPRAVLKKIATDLTEKYITIQQAISQNLTPVVQLLAKPEVKKRGIWKRFFAVEEVQPIYPVEIIAANLFSQGESFAESMPEIFLAFNDQELSAMKLYPQMKNIYVALKILNIPVNEFDLKPGDVFCTNNLLVLAAAMAREGLTDRGVFKRQPIEIIMQFRRVNRLVPESVRTLGSKHDMELISKREIPLKRLREYNRNCAELDAEMSLEKTQKQRDLKAQWKFDGRNNEFRKVLWHLYNGGYETVPGQWGERLSHLQLCCDPHLKPNDLDSLVPKDVSAEEYNQMRDSLIQLVENHHKRQPNLPKRSAYYKVHGVESEAERIKEENKYKEYARYGITGFFRYWRIEPGQHVSAEYMSERKRIVYVYRTLFEPLLKAERFIDALDEVHNIAEVGHGCKPGCLNCLVNMETRPTVGLIFFAAPTLEERVASILHRLRLKCITEIINKRVGDNVQDRDMFFKVTCNHFLSLMLQQNMVEGATVAKYYIPEFEADLKDFLQLYQNRMVVELLENISYKPMPAGDRNSHVIYLEQISDWAPETRWYCDTQELDEELLDEGKLRPQAAKRLLIYSGYLAFDNF